MYIAPRHYALMQRDYFCVITCVAAIRIPSCRIRISTYLPAFEAPGLLPSSSPVHKTFDESICACEKLVCPTVAAPQARTSAVSRVLARRRASLAPAEGPPCLLTLAFRSAGHARAAVRCAATLLSLRRAQRGTIQPNRFPLDRSCALSTADIDSQIDCEAVWPTPCTPFEVVREAAVEAVS
eukprot:811266-Pleurochrysis_carterae.AAC.1